MYSRCLLCKVSLLREINARVLDGIVDVFRFGGCVSNLANLAHDGIRITLNLIAATRNLWSNIIC